MEINLINGFAYVNLISDNYFDSRILKLSNSIWKPISDKFEYFEFVF